MRRSYAATLIMFFPPILSSLAIAWCVERFNETASPYYLFIIPVLYTLPVLIGILLTFTAFTYTRIRERGHKASGVVAYRLLAAVAAAALVFYLAPILFLPYNSVKINNILLELVFIHYILIMIFNIIILIYYILILPCCLFYNISMMNKLLNPRKILGICLKGRPGYVFKGLIAAFIAEVALSNIAVLYPPLDGIFIVPMPVIKHPELMKTINSLNYTIYDVFILIITILILMRFYSKYIDSLTRNSGA